MAKKSDAGSRKIAARNPHSDGPSSHQGDASSKGRQRRDDNRDNTQDGRKTGRRNSDRGRGRNKSNETDQHPEHRQESGSSRRKHPNSNRGQDRETDRRTSRAAGRGQDRSQERGRQSGQEREVDAAQSQYRDRRSETPPEKTSSRRPERGRRSEDRSTGATERRPNNRSDRSQNRRASDFDRPVPPSSRRITAPELHPFGPPAYLYDEEPSNKYDSREPGAPFGETRQPQWTDQYYDDYYGTSPQYDDVDEYQEDDHTLRARRDDNYDRPDPEPEELAQENDEFPIVPKFAGDYDDFYGPPASDLVDESDEQSRGRGSKRNDDERSNKKPGQGRRGKRDYEEQADEADRQERSRNQRSSSGRDDRRPDREEDFEQDSEGDKPSFKKREVGSLEDRSDAPPSTPDDKQKNQEKHQGNDRAAKGKSSKTPKHARSESPKEAAPPEAADTADADQDDGDRKPLHAQREAPPNEEQDHDHSTNGVENKGKRGKGRGKSSRRTADTRRLELPKIKISREFPSDEQRQSYLDGTKPLPLDAWSDTPECVRELILRVENQMHTELAVERGSRVILAVSGGVDSTVMLDIMVELAYRNNYELFVAHFNHRLRGDKADSDEEFVRKRAAELALPFISGAADINTYASRAKISVEQASRDVRYRFLEQVARKSNASLVATAHTANDTVETLLLNLMRGTGLTGLSGIPARRRFTKDCSLIRPFLNTKKDELETYAGDRGINWREDESNNLMLFTRNKIRHDLLPRLEADYSPAIVDILLRTSRLLNGADKAVTQMVERSVQRIVKAKGNSRITLLIAALKAHSEFLQGELLQRIIQKQFHILPMPIAAVDRLLALMDADVGSRTDISGRLFGLKDRETIIIAEKQPAYSLRKAVEKGQELVVGNHKLRLSEVAVDVASYENNPNVEFLDMESTPRRLTLRTWEPGDSFKPLGMRGTMKISDFLTNQKVPLIDKQHQLVLSTSRDILWVVGQRISNDFRVKKGAKTALKVEWSEVEDKN